jgi:ABC-type nitrate/sulfonate/bicarbonate transport system substrate-binding protein
VSRLRVIEFVAPGVEAIAQRRGLYAEHGVEIETVRTRSSTEQRERMQSGDCDVALTAIDNLIAWNAAGDDLVLVGQVERTTVLDLVAAAERIEDLRGTTLAVDAVDTGFAIVLRKILRDHGLGANDYELLAAGGIQQRCDAITGGQASGGLLGPPWSDQALAQGLRRLTTVEAALPDFPGIGVAVRSARLAELRDPLKRYLAALADAAAWAGAAPRDEAVALLVDAGFPPAGAGALLDVVPADVSVALDGVDLLYAMRRELDALPAGAPEATALVVTA